MKPYIGLTHAAQVLVNDCVKDVHSGETYSLLDLSVPTNLRDIQSPENNLNLSKFILRDGTVLFEKVQRDDKDGIWTALQNEDGQLLPESLWPKGTARSTSSLPRTKFLKTMSNGT